MRTSTRFGALTAAVALASATVLTGAGVAAAADLPPMTFDSDSTLGVAWVNGALQVTYDNQSGEALQCSVTVGESELIELTEAWIKGTTITEIVLDGDGRLDYVTLADLPSDELIKLHEQAFEDETVGSAMFSVGPEGSGTVDLEFDAKMGEFTNTDVDPSALSTCVTADFDYIEIETTYFESDATGSLEGVFGSATGSLGSATGSLGSLGS